VVPLRFSLNSKLFDKDHAQFFFYGGYGILFDFLTGDEKI